MSNWRDRIQETITEEEKNLLLDKFDIGKTRRLIERHKDDYIEFTEYLNSLAEKYGIKQEIEGWDGGVIAWEGEDYIIGEAEEAL